MRNAEFSSEGIIGVDRKDELRRRRDVLDGGKRAAEFIRTVELGKKVRGRKYDYDSNFILEIHRRVEHRSSDAGKLRQHGVEVDTDEAVKYTELPTRFYLFGKWLSRAVKEVNDNPDDIILALETAAAAHWGITSPELHPFSNGNGRTARALVNTVLMHSTDELRLHGIAILPVPILREDSGNGASRYIRALRSVRDTQTLNPLMSFIAQKWSGNVSEILKVIGNVHGPLNEADRRLIDTLRMREGALDGFVSDSNGADKNNFRMHPIPNYFDSVWLKGERVAQAI